MVSKIIKCPNCSEKIELTDLYDGMRVACNLCKSSMIFEKDKVLLVETNEEFYLEDLEYEEEEEEFEEEEFEEEEEFYEEYEE